MLVTAGTTFVRRRRIARLICHEVCHQWYGDIVTPQSFDELWLKEVSLVKETPHKGSFPHTVVGDREFAQQGLFPLARQRANSQRVSFQRDFNTPARLL